MDSFLRSMKSGRRFGSEPAGGLRRVCASVALLLLCLTAGGCATTQVSTTYYDVAGASSRDLMRDIRRKGPKDGTAIAMAGIDIRPVSLETSVGERGCRFRTARFRVKADLTLPRWREAASSRDAELRRGWTGFAAYARAHEEMHVAIAEAFARALERAFLAIPPQPSCVRLETAARELVRKVGPAHQRAQLAFDAAEQKRFARLAARDAGRRTR